MKTKISLDPSLVVPWSLDLIQQEPYEYPFKAKYLFKNKRLIYIASLHDCNSNSLTFDLIRNVFRDEKIDFVIVEGIHHSLGITPDKTVKWASLQGDNERYTGFETAFAISMSVQKKVPFRGGEPDDTYILSEILKNNYSIKDLFFYYFVQQIFQSREEKLFSSLDVENAFSKLMQIKYKNIELESLPDFMEFQSWFAKNNRQIFVPSQLDENDIAPYENGELITQKISSVVCRARDRFVITCIEQVINSYDSVLVIYGGSHWSTQRHALERVLGIPSFSN